MHLEVVGKRSDKCVPCVCDICKETAFCLRKAVAVSRHHEIIQLQRQVIDTVHPLSQSGKLGIEILQMLRHIVSFLDQLDHGIHHIHDTGCLVSGLHALSEHLHHRIQSRILYFQSTHHIRYIAGNLVITVFVRIRAGYRRKLTVQIIQIINTCIHQIHCIGQISQCGIHGYGILSLIEIEVVIPVLSSYISCLPVRPVIKFNLSRLYKRKLAVDSQITCRIESSVQILFESDTDLVETCLIHFHIPGNVLSCSCPVLPSNRIVYDICGMIRLCCHGCTVIIRRYG